MKPGLRAADGGIYYLAAYLSDNDKLLLVMGESEIYLVELLYTHRKR